MTPGVHLPLPWWPGATYMYRTLIVKQVYWYISQISGECLQDHWSSSESFTIAGDSDNLLDALL